MSNCIKCNKPRPSYGILCSECDKKPSPEKSGQEDVVKPKRYNKKGKLECWDVIIDQEMNFLEGSVLKYLWRYKEKNGTHDLKKAIQYLEKMIKEYEKDGTNS